MATIDMDGPVPAAINLNSNGPTVVSAADLEQGSIFTCLNCAVAFHTPVEQREHHSSDWHRYNMKRRVATLPPVTAALFNRKVIERRNENAVTATKHGETCNLCAKSFASQGAYRTHVESKKHRDVELKEATRLLRGGLLASEVEKDEVASYDPTTPRPAPPPTASTSTPGAGPSNSSSTATPAPFVQPTTTSIVTSFDSYAPNQPVPGAVAPPTLAIDADATEEEITQSIDAKIAFARTRLTPTSCLFCSHAGESQEDTLEHMALAHGFFVPDQEYLIDVPGLILYLSEKVAIGNVCLYCNGKGKEYKSMDAVRKHMIDKSHCKLAYDTESARMELSEYYDFRSSYPDSAKRRHRRRRAVKTIAPIDEEWEDEDMDAENASNDDGEEPEVIMQEGSDAEGSDDGSGSDGESSYSSSSSLSDSDQIRYDPQALELVLPSGRRIGHRSLQRYYNQRPSQPREAPEPGPRRNITDKTDQGLISRRGGFGNNGEGGEVIKARNKGEARNATKNPYRAMQQREHFKMKTGFIHNSQKHWRDHLLQ